MTLDNWLIQGGEIVSLERMTTQQIQQDCFDKGLVTRAVVCEYNKYTS